MKAAKPKRQGNRRGPESAADGVVGLVTCASRAEARRLARAILDRHAAACVNILSGLESHYWWQGRLEQAREFLLLIKTTRARTRALIEVVRATHSYAVPEIIWLPVAGGEPNYLNWLREAVGKI